MRYFCSKQNKFVIVPSIKNMISTLNGFIYLSKKILGIYPKKFILTRVIQQDSLENFFCCIRGYSGRESMPSASHFQSSFKALIINNFMSSHSPGANCEEDDNEGPLSNLRHFITGEVFPGILSLPNDVSLPPVPPEIAISRRTKLGKCTINYISGFIFKKLLRKINCAACRQNLSFRDQNVDLDFIEARQYEKCNLKVPGTYLSFLFNHSISRLFYLIPRLCHMPKISHVLENIISNQLQFSLINCKAHDSNHVIMIRVIIRCCLFFWCKRVNLVTNGKDEKFSKFLKSKPNINIIDPIKLKAYKRYQTKLKRVRK